MWPPRPDGFDVVVVGDRFDDWLEVLAPESEIWQGLPGIATVRRAPTGWQGGEGAERRLVLPLLESDIGACPAGWALVPDREALKTFGDKARFANFVERDGLGQWAPRTYASPKTAIFPCVVKRTDLNASHGVQVVFSAAELADCLGRRPWTGHPYVLQEYIEAEVDYSINGVAVDGLLVFHRTFVFDLPEDSLIRIPMGDELVGKVDLKASHLFAIQRFIAACRFNGPFNVSARVRASGELAVIEINPRMGGSMYRPSTRDDLREQIRFIMQNARWHDPNLPGRSETAGSHA